MEKKSNVGLIVVIVILVMLLIFGGVLFFLSSQEYLKFDKEEVTDKNEEDNVLNEDNNRVLSTDEVLIVAKDLYGKIENYFESVNTYCGESGFGELTHFDSDITGNGYYKSKDFNSYTELKSYLLNYMNEDVIIGKWSKDNYLEINDGLYCHNSGKGGYWDKSDYDVIINSVTMDSIDASINIKYYSDNIVDFEKNVSLSLSKNKTDGWIISEYKVID